VEKLAGRGIFLFGLTVAVIVGVVVAVRYLREAENRQNVVDKMEGNRALRPLLALGRRLQPPARFLWDRLTPGGLGLEFTTLLATFAVGSFVFIGFALLLGDEPGPTPGDRAALDVVRDIHAAWLTDLAEAVTQLGAGYVVFPLAAIAAIVLVVQRRFGAAAVLVVGMLIVKFGVDIAKEATDRPRPADSLIDTEGSSYPSGHAANSVFYTWLAVTLAFFMTRRELTRRITVRGLVFVLGLALTAAVGLSRVYLRAHYLSDVTGGWALGASAFALCAMIAILVHYLRQPSGSPVRDNPAQSP
jgi:undecaprenyl-diphosphatase